jgi:phage baseplate assembly protein W
MTASSAAAVLSSLAAALRAHGTVPLAWVVEWCPDGRDVVAEAWAVCEHGETMRDVLYDLDAGSDESWRAWGAVHTALGMSSRTAPRVVVRRAMADAVRRVVPRLTLADVLGRGAR